MGKLTWQYIRRVQRGNLLRGKLKLPMESLGIIGKPHRKQFAIYYEDKYLGFARRGHVYVQALSGKRRKGIFSAALKKIEELERNLAKNSPDKYLQYINDIITDELKLANPDEVGFISKLVLNLGPGHYFDYTPHFDTAIALVKNGYIPTPETRKRLENETPALKKNANPEEIAHNLELLYGTGKVLDIGHWLVFTKPM